MTMPMIAAWWLYIWIYLRNLWKAWAHKRQPETFNTERQFWRNWNLFIKFLSFWRRRIYVLRNHGRTIHRTFLTALKLFLWIVHFYPTKEKKSTQNTKANYKGKAILDNNHYLVCSGYLREILTVNLRLFEEISYIITTAEEIFTNNSYKQENFNDINHHSFCSVSELCLVVSLERLESICGDVKHTYHGCIHNH